MSTLTPEQEATLRFLRGQVDKAEAECFRLNRHMNVQQDLFRARKELRVFVEALRAEGKHI
jgi:hypothetical protein